MFRQVSISGGEVVLGRDSMNYQKVIDDFRNAHIVRILTFNISKSDYRNCLLDALRMVQPGADVKIITNIPSRMPTYYNTPSGDVMRGKYTSTYEAYLKRLNPDNFPSNPEIAFNFTNHAKIIGTENILYIGSANYSDESSGNLESGTIITDKVAIAQIYADFFPAILAESIPYFDDAFNELRLFVLSMKTKFEKWLFWFDNHLVYVNETSGTRHLYDTIELDEDGLYELNSTIEELTCIVGHLQNTYSEEDEEYNDLINKILEAFDTISVSWMLEFTTTDSPFYELISYDAESRVNEILCDNPEAYDENLNDCVNEAMSAAYDEFFDLRLENEKDIAFLRDEIDKVIHFLDRVYKRTLEHANKLIIQKVDNT